MRTHLKYLSSSFQSSAHYVYEGCLFLDNQIDRVWVWFLAYLYEIVPTREGELGEVLKEEIDEGFLFIGVRLRTFNSSVGFLVKLCVSTTSIAIFTSLIFVATEVLPSHILTTALMLIALFIAGIALIISVGAIGLADFLILLYIGSFVWFGIQRARQSLQIETKGSDNTYRFRLEERTSENFEEIYQDNLATFFRTFVYGLIAILLFLMGRVLPWVSEWLTQNQNTIPIDRPDSMPFISLIQRVIRVVNSIIPIDLSEILAPENAVLVLFIAGIFLVFAIFLNVKRVAQHAVRSQFGWSALDEFTFWEELGRFWNVTKIVLYQLREGDQHDRYEIVRGHILLAFWWLLLGSGLSAFYAYLLLNI